MLIGELTGALTIGEETTGAIDGNAGRLTGANFKIFSGRVAVDSGRVLSVENVGDNCGTILAGRAPVSCDSVSAVVVDHAANPPLTGGVPRGIDK